MAHKFKCTACGKEMLVKWLDPGEQAKCRACGADVTVPADAKQVPDDSLPGPAPARPPAVSAPKPGCQTCRHLQPAPSFFDNGIGHCRRFPPHQRYRYPEVTAADWCGEYSAKE